MRKDKTSSTKIEFTFQKINIRDSKNAGKISGLLSNILNSIKFLNLITYRKSSFTSNSANIIGK